MVSRFVFPALLSAILAFGTVFGAPSALGQDQPQIRVCDMRELTEAHPGFRAFTAEQIQRRLQFSKEEEALLQRIRDLRNKVIATRDELAGPDREEQDDTALRALLFDTIQQGIIAERALRDQEFEFEKKTSELARQAMETVQEELQESVNQFATDQQYDLLLDSAGVDPIGRPLVIYATDRIDVTPGLLKPSEWSEPKTINDLKVAVVDFAKLREIHPMTAKNDRKFDEITKRLNEMDRARANALRTKIETAKEKYFKKDELQPGNQPRSPKELNFLKAAMGQKNLLDQWRARMMRSLEEKQAIESQKLSDLVLEEIRDFAKTTSYDLILDRSAGNSAGTPLIPGSLDTNNITPEVRTYSREKLTAPDLDDRDQALEEN